MTNIYAPFGFRISRRQDGAAPNFNLTERQVASNNATKIGFGDPVTSLNTGYIAQSVAGTTQIAGIFQGCKYLSTSRGMTVWSQYWPGADATGDVTAYVIDDPSAVFLAQVGTTGLGPVTIANVNNNINFAIGTVNTLTGQSTSYLNYSTIQTTTTLPFRILGLLSVNDPNTDNTSANNLIEVAFNFQDFKSATGI